MSIKRPVALLLLLCLTFCLAESAYGASGSLKSMARDAVAEDAARRAAAVAALRAAGPEGLDALFAEYQTEIARARAGEAAGVADWARIAEALDAVGRQKDDFTSGLYWYTDIEEARGAARAAGKPILSLRLLGRLDEEYSCANSRFFRTALYANAEVSKYLRENFVLHWKSVRPAPVVTIDYGDGRKLVRTITGNSIHYVLDAQGRPIDALPGLYGPRAFIQGLGRAREMARLSTTMEGEQRASFLAGYYNRQSNEVIDGLQLDAKRAGVRIPEGVVVSEKRKPFERPTVAPQASQAQTATGQQKTELTTMPPTALWAAPMAITKRSLEAPVVRAITYSPVAFDRVTGEAEWTKLAALHLERARLDAASVSLIRRHGPYVGARAEVTPERLARVVANFEQRMALDTVRNEYLIRPVVLRWLWEADGRADVEQLNRRVYAQLFLTPDTDPWLGLLPPDTYAALANDGVVVSKTPPPNQ